MGEELRNPGNDADQREEDNPPADSSGEGEQNNRAIRIVHFLWVNSGGTLLVVSALVILVLTLAYGIPVHYVLKGIVREYEQAEERDSAVDRHIESGNAFLDVGQATAAKSEFERALELDPTDPNAQEGLYKAQTFEPFEDPENIEVDAELAYRRLTSLEHRGELDEHGLVFLGNMYAVGFPNDALRLYEDALHERRKYCEEEDVRNCPSLAAAHFGKGQIYARRGDIEGAINSFDAAVMESGWNALYRHQLGYMYLQNGRYTDAINEISTGIYYDPYLLTPYLDVVAAYLLRGKSGDLKDALSFEKRLIEYMEKEDVVSLERNQQGWWDFVDPHLEACRDADLTGVQVQFDSERMEKSFSYYQAALTTFLIRERGHVENSEDYRPEEYVNKAKTLPLDSDEVARVECELSSTIEYLKGERPSLRGTLDEFRNQYL